MVLAALARNLRSIPQSFPQSFPQSEVVSEVVSEVDSIGKEILELVGVGQLQ